MSNGRAVQKEFQWSRDCENNKRINSGEHRYRPRRTPSLLPFEGHLVALSLTRTCPDAHDWANRVANLIWNKRAWCLWCLLEAEIRATYAKQLKQLQ
jgi:hypothetical protein